MQPHTHMMKWLVGMAAWAACLSVGVRAQNVNNPPLECDPCYCSAPCPNGTFVYDDLYMYNNEEEETAVFCLGETINAQAWFSTTISDPVIGHYWYGNANSSCPPGAFTNTYGVSIITNWWVVSGPVTYSLASSNMNQICEFRPTQCGSGTVTFYTTWANHNPCSDICDGYNEFCNIRTTSISSNFTVVGVASLAPSPTDLASGLAGLEPGSDPPKYWICPCPGDVIVTAVSCPELTAGQLPACWSFTGGTEIDKLNRKVSRVALLSGEVTFTVTAGTSTQTIILKTDEEKERYDAIGAEQNCGCDNWNDSSLDYDKCGNSLAIDCVGAVGTIGGIGCDTLGHFEYMYNGNRVGKCYYGGGLNLFFYKTTIHNCRFLRTWHLTQDPATPRWVVTKYNSITGSGPTENCRTHSTYTGIGWAPADEPNPGFPGASCEIQGTTCTPCPGSPCTP